MDNKIVVYNKGVFKGSQPLGINVDIGRPGLLGNPWQITYPSKPNYCKTRDEAIENYRKAFREWMLGNDEEHQPLRNLISRLSAFYMKGYTINLMCWCKPQACHGDVIKEYIEKRVLH